MGLVTCPDCGKQVSDSSPICIACGRPTPPPKPPEPEPKKRWRWLPAAGTVLGACLLAGGLLCLVLDREGYAAVGLFSGMACILGAGLAGWFLRD